MLEVDIEKQLQDFHLRVAFTVGDEVLVLFGPSGAGKSLTLQCIAGLQTPTRGHIRLNGQLLFQSRPGQHRRQRRPYQLPLKKRRVGFVQQHYALFPHLTVAQNILYGVKRAVDRRAHLEAWLERMRLEGLEDRFPHQLSGGQRQRVALARALAAEPQALLLDEPFAALDLGVREQLQEDLRALQGQLHLPTIYVTHNLSEAFALGDRLAVIDGGVLQQIGPMDQVFTQPSTQTVARVTGLRNVLDGRVVEATPEALVLAWGPLRLKAPPQRREPGERVSFYIRPEDIKLIYPDRPPSEAVRHNLVRAAVCGRVSGGAQVTLRVVPQGQEEVLEVRFSRNSYRSLDLSEGATVTLSLRKEAIFILPHSGQAGE